MAKKFSEIEREDDLRIMAFRIYGFWDKLVYFPDFVLHWDSGAEDLYKMAVQYPLLMSFQSCKFDSDLDVLVDKFREIFIHVIRACAEYVFENKSYVPRMSDFFQSFHVDILLRRAYVREIRVVITEVMNDISDEEDITVCLEKLRGIVGRMLQ
jgi:hypothetical protein